MILNILLVTVSLVFCYYRLSTSSQFTMLPVPQEPLRFQCVAQGHLGTPRRRGAGHPNSQPDNAVPPELLPPHMKSHDSGDHHHHHLTGDSVHLVLRCGGVANEVAEGGEGDAGVQGQAQHEVMHLEAAETEAIRLV